MARALPKWRVRLAGVAILLLLTVVALASFYLSRILPQSPIFETFGYLGVFVLTTLCSATLFLPAPAFGAIGVAGGILNPFLVGAVAGAGAATGEMTGYLAGRSGQLVLGSGALRRLDRVRGWLERYGFWMLFLLSAIPNPVFDIAGLAAGSLGYPIHRYWLAVALGKGLIYSAIALLGSAILPQFVPLAPGTPIVVP